MPVKSQAQKRFMQAVEHNPDFAKKADVPQSVAKEMLHPGGVPAKPKPSKAEKRYGKKD